MYVPFISTRNVKPLERRKGGGGGGGGKGGGSSSSSSGGGSSGSSSSGGSRSSSVSTNSGSRSASSYGNGGGSVSTIPSGSMFAGRQQGGGSRQQVFGSSVYGSGYPGIAGQRGTAGLGFPFYYWPLAWGGVAGVGGAAYLHNNEYGRSDNSSRPGGAMTIATFVSNSQNTTFRVVADNDTVVSLIGDINSNCSSNINTSQSSSSPSAYTNDTRPESTVQYYRASSVALTLDGYNNTASLQDNYDESRRTPLPQNIDNNLLNCLNQTMGVAVPLIDSDADNAALQAARLPNLGLLTLVGLAWSLMSAL